MQPCSNPFHYFSHSILFLFKKSVCGNTYKMLHDTRLKEYFDFVGTWDHHYGIFEGCGSSLPYTAVSDATGDKGASTGGCC